MIQSSKILICGGVGYFTFILFIFGSVLKFHNLAYLVYKSVSCQMLC